MARLQNKAGVPPKGTRNLSVSGIPYILPLVVHFTHGSTTGLGAFTGFLLEVMVL